MKQPTFILLILLLISITIFSCAPNNSNYISNAKMAKDCDIDISGIWVEYHIKEIRRRVKPEGKNINYKTYTVTSRKIIGPKLNTTYFFEKDCEIKAYTGGNNNFKIFSKSKDTLVWSFNFSTHHQRIIFLKRR